MKLIMIIGILAVALFVIFRKSIFSTFGDAGAGVTGFFSDTGKGITDFFSSLDSGGSDNSLADTGTTSINPDPTKQTDAEQEELFGRTLTREEELIINYNDNPTLLTQAEKDEAQALIQAQIDNDPQLNDPTKFQDPNLEDNGPPFVPNYAVTKRTTPTPTATTNPVIVTSNTNSPTPVYTNYVNNQEIGYGGITAEGGSIRPIDTNTFSEAEQSLHDRGLTIREILQRRNIQSQEPQHIQDARAEAARLLAEDVAELDRQNSSNNANADLIARAREANQNSQGAHFGRTPEEIAQAILGGNINNF